MLVKVRVYSYLTMSDMLDKVARLSKEDRALLLQKFIQQELKMQDEVRSSLITVDLSSETPIKVEQLVYISAFAHSLSFTVSTLDSSLISLFKAIQPSLLEKQTRLKLVFENWENKQHFKTDVQRELHELIPLVKELTIKKTIKEDHICDAYEYFMDLDTVNFEQSTDNHKGSVFSISDAQFGKIKHLSLLMSGWTSMDSRLFGALNRGVVF